MIERGNDTDTPEPETDLSRRRMLGGLAAMSGAAIVAPPSAVSAGTSTAKCAKGADVIVIGGGFAGCVAARELAHRGHKVTLLEAQGRLGGRAFTSDFAGKKCELGAVMMSWKEPFLWAEVTRYGLEIEPIVGALSPERCYWVTGGQSRSAPAEEFFQLFVPPVSKFYEDLGEAFPYPYAPLTNLELVEKLDRLSVLDRLKTFPDSQARDFADNWASVPLGRQASKVGLAATMALVSAFGGVQASLEGASYRLKDGTAALVRRIVEDGGFEIRMNSPVSALTQSDSGAMVTIEGGETLRAAKVVIAAPVNTYERIKFSPSLSTLKLEASKGKMAGAQGVHVNARLKGKMPPLLAVGPSDLPLHLMLTTDVLDDSVIVDAYGPDATILDGSDVAAVQKAVRNWIPDAEVLETLSYRWDLDPFAEGTWCGFGPGVLTKYFDALRQAEGHVYFASGDSASAFRGFMEGAVESGVRVARDVHEALRSHPRFHSC
jgi:monoamine oxidase